MSILKIARMGHPILARRADAVADPSDPAIRRLVIDMADTMLDAGGIGLAAPQVHVPLRLVIYGVPRARLEAESGGDGPIPFTVLINPEITPLSEEREEGVEGCLSLPGMQGRVPRFTAISVRAQGLDGQWFEREAHGYHARVVQHECDHLDGILYPLRMSDLSSFGYSEEMRKGGAANHEEPDE